MTQFWEWEVVGSGKAVGLSEVWQWRPGDGGFKGRWPTTERRASFARDRQCATRVEALWRQYDDGHGQHGRKHRGALPGGPTPYSVTVHANFDLITKLPLHTLFDLAPKS